MSTEDFYSTGRLVNFGNCTCSDVETNLCKACILFRLLISNIPRYFYVTSSGLTEVFSELNIAFLYVVGLFVNR